MITLTRLSGTVFALNSDLIERVDCTPDTVITLVDGTKYLVQESLSDVVRAIRAYRGGIIAESARLADEAEAEAHPAPLHVDPQRTPVGEQEHPGRRRLAAVPSPQPVHDPDPRSGEY